MDGDQVDKMDDFMLPGFRFHPTDEELVGFYLKKKIQHRPLPIELIKQVDIYKYDPWDLPNLALSGEKEWYFYCPRDRKYKNSARPNRVTGAGFWKATGTDRPIYSSDGTKCVGLKKSLVFYKGRAAKGMKTDWMMHEFRLPSPADQPAKKIVDKSLPPNDAWAICRIFKKTNSMAHRVISQSWVSSLTHDKTPDFLAQSNQFSTPDNISCMMDPIYYSDDLKLASGDGVLALEIPSYRPVYQTACKTSPFPLPFTDFPGGFMFSSADTPEPTTNTTPDVASLFNLGDHASNTCESIGLGGEQQQPFDNFSMTHSHDLELGDLRTCGFTFGLPSTAAADGWKGNMPWESPTCPSEMSATNSTNRCHT